MSDLRNSLFTELLEEWMDLKKTGPDDEHSSSSFIARLARVEEDINKRTSPRHFLCIRHKQHLRSEPNVQAA